MKKKMIIGTMVGLILSMVFSTGAVRADTTKNMVDALREYYAVSKIEDIQAYMAIMDLSDADNFPPGHIENTRQLALDVWKMYDILEYELNDIEAVVDEAGEYGLIRYHISQVLQGPDSEGVIKSSTMDIDYIALMHNTDRWQIVYLMPEAAYVRNVANLSGVNMVADMIEEDRDRITNIPPEASFSIMPESPQGGDTVILTSTALDPDGDELIYSWYLDSEFVSQASDSNEWKWLMPEDGEHEIKLVVNDGRGGTDDYSVIITAGGGGLSTGTIMAIAAGGIIALLIFGKSRRQSG